MRKPGWEKIWTALGEVKDRELPEMLRGLSKHSGLTATESVACFRSAQLIDRLKAENERLTKERDAITLKWFREMADTPKGEERLYDYVGSQIYRCVDDETAIAAIRKIAGLDPERSES